MGLDWAQEKSITQEGRGKGTTFERMTELQGIHKQIKINGVQDDKSNSSKPSPICKLNDTPRGGRTVPRHCQKRSGWFPKAWGDPPTH